MNCFCTVDVDGFQHSCPDKVTHALEIREDQALKNLGVAVRHGFFSCQRHVGEAFDFAAEKGLNPTVVKIVEPRPERREVGQEGRRHSHGRRITAGRREGRMDRRHRIAENDRRKN